MTNQVEKDVMASSRPTWDENAGRRSEKNQDLVDGGVELSTEIRVKICQANTLYT